jgi:hypothetical protein
LADVRSVFVESHRRGRTGVDLGAPPLDLGVPRGCRADVRLAVEAADQLEGEPRSSAGRRRISARTSVAAMTAF